jgi:hypothetical protein
VDLSGHRGSSLSARGGPSVDLPCAYASNGQTQTRHVSEEFFPRSRGDRATNRWRYRFGDGPADSVRGVNLMRVRDGLITEALGYSKTPDQMPLL